MDPNVIHEQLALQMQIYALTKQWHGFRLNTLTTITRPPPPFNNNSLTTTVMVMIMTQLLPPW
jgi:hypothetical protein